MNNVDQIASTLQRAGFALSEEDEVSIALWQKGKDLEQLSRFQGWTVALEMIGQMVRDANDDLLDLAPGDPRVPTAHAAASALADFFRKFRQDIDTAIRASTQPPDCLLRAKNALATETPIEVF